MCLVFLLVVVIQILKAHAPRHCYFVTVLCGELRIYKAKAIKGDYDVLSERFVHFCLGQDVNKLTDDLLSKVCDDYTIY
mgnify:CR=1 FL=1